MSTTNLSKDTRRDLWIKSGARCEYRGCNAPIDRNFLTQERVNLGEFCHIIGDSAKGPRGDADRSKELATDISNLILCCRRCHKTIDDSKLQGSYTETILVEMKREHELHIQRLYDARDVKRSLPIILTGSIAGTPTHISEEIVRHAVLQKTNYRRFPSHESHLITLNNIGLGEKDPDYWKITKKQLDLRFQELFCRRGWDQIEHVDVFAMAQIPLLMYAGYLLGDRIPATVHQPLRDQDNAWLWPSEESTPAEFSYTLPEEKGLNELALAVSLSGQILNEDVEKAVPGLKLATFEAASKSPKVISSEADQRSFVTSWQRLLSEIHNRFGYITLHVFPAVPVSAAFEMGRSIHPKVMPEIQVWDYASGVFTPKLRFSLDEA